MKDMGKHILELTSLPTVSVVRTGVVNLGYGNKIEVDSEDMVREVLNAVDAINPSTDYNSNFAACVEISITFLGEIKEAQDGP